MKSGTSGLGEKLRARGGQPYDAIIVGSGPNGLAAAISLACAGKKALVIEGHEQPGGGMRTAGLTLPGFRHDVCSAIHPLGIGSPFFRALPLGEYGLRWIHPPVPLAHPFDDGTAAALYRSIDDTAAGLGVDGSTYRRLMSPVVRDWEKIITTFFGPLRWPRHPLAMARFGLPALLPSSMLARLAFRMRNARSLFAGLAAHAIQPLESTPTAAFGLMLGMLGHAVGWPLPDGGSQAIADAMIAHLRELGGDLVTGEWVENLSHLPQSRAVLLDIAPRQLLALTGNQFPTRYRAQLERYRYGPGVFKLDIALAGPIPWTADTCRHAGTVHVGGTMEEIADYERAAFEGRHHVRPFVIVTQQSLFDPTRAPEGKHTLWAYCHVPHGSTTDMTEPVLDQIERFAPGVRDLILDAHTMHAMAFERYNPNYVGGDINAGVQNLRQLFTRPAIRLDPYSTPLEGLFLCSAATPPGGGVHGMCGYHAAQSALEWLEGQVGQKGGGWPMVARGR